MLSQETIVIVGVNIFTVIFAGNRILSALQTRIQALETKMDLLLRGQLRIKNERGVSNGD